jgi:hypothetical protein
MPDVFTVLFCAPGVRGASASAPLALLSPSTRGLRSRLAAAGVRFTMPLAPDADVGADGALRELQEYERANPGSTRIYGGAHAGAAGVDHTPSSALIILGQLPVHALFNFLHNFRPADSSRDVPLLLAGAPFEHACIAPLRLVAGARQRLEPHGAALGAGAGGDGVMSSRREVVFHATVRSAAGAVVPIGPWTISRLCEVLRGSQDGEFAARFDAAPHTPAFNLALPLPEEEDNARGGGGGGAGGATSRRAAAADAAAAAREPPQPRGAYGNAAERAAAREPLGWPDEVLGAVVCKDGIFTLPPQDTKR